MKILLLFVVAILAISSSLSVVVNAQTTQQYEDTNNWVHSQTINGLSGVASRPYVTALSVKFANGTTSSIFSGLTSATQIYAKESVAGSVTPVISPTNLCTPSNNGGQCYTVPNRVQFSLNCKSSSGGGTTSDLGSSGCDAFKNAVFDITVNTNAFYNKIQWSYMSGKLSYWVNDETTKILRLKVQAQDSDTFGNPPSQPNQCCTCNPPSNCDVNAPAGRTNQANFFTAIETAGQGSTEFKGAVFTTNNAWMGFLDATPRGNKGDRELKYFLTGASYVASGSSVKNQALLRSFLPRDTLAKVFPSLNGAYNSGKLNVTRNGQPVDLQSISITSVGAGDFGTQGLIVEVTNITFSVPVYGVFAGSGMVSGIAVLISIAILALLF